MTHRSSKKANKKSQKSQWDTWGDKSHDCHSCDKKSHKKCHSCEDHSHLSCKSASHKKPCSNCVRISVYTDCSKSLSCEPSCEPSCHKPKKCNKRKDECCRPVCLPCCNVYDPRFAGSGVYSYYGRFGSFYGSSYGRAGNGCCGLQQSSCCGGRRRY